VNKISLINPMLEVIKSNLSNLSNLSKTESDFLREKRQSNEGFGNDSEEGGVSRKFLVGDERGKLRYREESNALFRTTQGWN